MYHARLRLKPLTAQLAKFVISTTTPVGIAVQLLTVVLQAMSVVTLLLYCIINVILVSVVAIVIA